MYSIFSKFLVVHSFLILLIVLGGNIFFDLFVFKKEESISMTYYGFAIFAVLASICFSYSRNFEKMEDQLYVRGIGERFLLSALVFLIGSILNYLYINRTLFFNNSNYTSTIKEICSYSAAGFFISVGRCVCFEKRIVF